MKLVQITSRWESTDTHEVPDDKVDEIVDAINGGDIDVVIAIGDVDTVGAELVDYSAREVSS